MKKKYKTFLKRKKPPKLLTVTLITAAGQKAREKSLNGTYRLQRRNIIKNHHHENLGVSNLLRKSSALILP